MATVEKEHQIVKESLIKFVSGHIPEADFSVVDEIILSYIISILEEAANDPGFDIDGFIEMMNAYFEKFSEINSSIICEWIFQLEKQLTEERKSIENRSSTDIPLTSLSLSDIIPEEKLVNQKHERVKHLSETSDGGSTDSSNCDFFSEECDILQEMFPDTCYLEVKHCISIAKGDIDTATQILLHRQENGQSLNQNNCGLQNPQRNVIDDAELKNRIIARYSYVDKNAATKEYKPVAPKVEPKKLVRYRDNKIVSLRGERYTEVHGDNEADLKKPKKPIHP
ncbi:CUE domain-containing protein 2-A [Condylostylus longicornis]|uniref:CUE domain-containing protein 2-A n=1 Tax=Condylostylus longicornis TaxID=2530218 RepID=UPI00244DFBD7|nr:CUE domain-containing protein 2-A [Condylostylus longicornis]